MNLPGKENAAKLSRIWLILMGPAGLSLACVAQSGARADIHPPSPPPQPSAELQSLTKAIGGKWSTTYKFEPSDTMPAGGAGDGEEVWRSGPGGLTLMEEEHFRAGTQETYIFALHWWDKSTNSLRGMLCNNSGPATCNVDSYYHSSLKWDGKRFVIDFEFPQKGKKMMWHDVWSDITATSFTQTGDMGEAGNTLKRVVTIHGSKVTN